MLRKIKYLLLNLKLIINILKDEKSSPFKTSFNQKVLSLTNGFSSDKANIYGYDTNNIKKYTSDYHRAKARRVNEKYYQVYDNKLITERVLSQYVTMPKSFFMLRKGIVTSLVGTSLDHVKIQDIANFVMDNERVVLKPVYGGSGTGVKVVNYDKTTQEYIVNNEHFTKDEFNTFISKLDDYLLTEFVVQGKYSSQLFSESTNTIRMVTMVDPKTKEPFVAAAAQRIGTNKTKPTDNFGGGKGGISVLIDTDTGELTEAATITAEGKKRSITNHIDSNQPIVGKTVPHWNEIKSSVLDTIKRNPFLRYVGWDIVVTDKGFTVIEINSFSGLTVLQVHKPFNEFDNRIEEFYKHHKII